MPVREWNRRCCGLVALAACALAAVPAAGAAERPVGLDAQRGVAVTIYNDDLALVKDRRAVTLGAGESDLAFVDVSAQMRPETVVFTMAGAGGGLRVLEQNFNFDLLTPRKLLEKSVGETVRLIRVNPATGEENVEEAEVLSTNDGVLLRIGDRIEAIGFGGDHDLPGRVVFERMPDDLRARPTLVLSLASAQDVDDEAVLSYLTGGLSWRADYVARLADDEKRLALQGWVTLTNTSGTAYRDARLQLVAGDVNRVRPAMMRRLGAETMASAAVPEADMAEEAFFDYHLYTLSRPTTILENQTKQVALLSAPEVSVVKEYLAEGQPYYYQSRAGAFERQKVGVWLELDNEEAEGLGVPLPRGIVRVYKEDSAGGAQFVGEDSIDHTPEGDEVRLQLGRAFDVTIDRRQTDYRDNRSRNETAWEFETAHEIVVRNAKDETVTVKVVEPMPGDWRILSESLPHEKENAQTAAWHVEVPAKGETTLTYRVRVVLRR